MAIGKTSNVVTIYVKDGANYEEITGVQSYTVSKRLNELSQFSFNFMGINQTLRDKILVFSEVFFMISSNLFLKGRIQTVNNTSAFNVEVMGYGMEVKLFDKQFTKDNAIRIDYTTPTSTNTIAKQILSQNSDGNPPWDLEPLNPSTIATFGDVQMRFENSYKLPAVGELTKLIGQDWWLTHSSNPFNDDFINIDTMGTDKSSSFFFKFTGSGANADISNDQRDASSTINYVRYLGYGDGINQLAAQVYSQGNANSVLASDITSTDTTITLLDASGFTIPTTTEKVRIMSEIITYSGISGNDLTGCVRGVDSTTAREHKKTVFVEEHTDWTTRDELEAIMVANTGIGIQEKVETDRKLRDLPTMEVLASIFLLNHKDEYRRVELVANRPQDVIGIVDVGDTVEVIDSTNGLSDDLRIQSFTITGGFGIYKLNVELSNLSLGLVELVKKINQLTDEEGQYMLGATDLFWYGKEDNCNNSNPLTLDFYVPEDVIAVNSVKLNFSRTAFRGYTANDDPSTGAAYSISTGTLDAQEDFTDQLFTIVDNINSQPINESYLGTSFNLSLINLSGASDDYTLEIESPLGSAIASIGPSTIAYEDGLQLTYNIPDDYRGGTVYGRITPFNRGDNAQFTVNYNIATLGVLNTTTTEVDVGAVVNINGTDVSTLTPVGVGYKTSTEIDLSDYAVAGWNTVTITPTEITVGRDSARFSMNGYVKCFIEST